MPIRTVQKFPITRAGVGILLVAGSLLVAVPSSSAAASATPHAPTTLIATPGNGSAVISWKAPSSPGRSKILSYEAFVQSSNVHCITTKTSCTLSGLTNGTSYAITVKAKNAYGFGAPSAPITVIPGTPTKPNAVVLHGTGGAINVNWLPPSSSGHSTITGYVATARHGSSSASCTTTSSSTLTCSITGLTVGTSYQIVVQARNSYGLGTPSAATAASLSFAINCSYFGPYAVLTHCDLANAKLSSANLSDANLFGANLNDADLFGANLDTANLAAANLATANLIYANLSNSTMIGANFSGAELNGANLSGAEIETANFSGASLILVSSGGILTGAVSNIPPDPADGVETDQWLPGRPRGEPAGGHPLLCQPRRGQPELRPPRRSQLHRSRPQRGGPGGLKPQWHQPDRCDLDQCDLRRDHQHTGLTSGWMAADRRVPRQ
jgi:hypothetical protein